MTSKKLIQSTILNDSASSLPVTDVPVDAGDNEVVVVTSAKTLRINVRSDLAIVVLTWVVINGFVGAMIGVGVDILAELDIVVVISVLKVFMGVTCVGDVWAGV